MSMRMALTAGKSDAIFPTKIVITNKTKSVKDGAKSVSP